LSRRTLLETGLIRCARASSVVSLEEILRRISTLQQSAGLVGAAPAAPAAPAPHGAAASSSAAPAAAARAMPPAARPAIAPAAPSAGPAADPKKKVDPEADLALLASSWHEVIDRVGRIAVLGRGCLMDARPLSVTESHVVIGFDPEFAGNMENARTGRVLQAVQRVLGQILARPLAIEYTLMDASIAAPLPTDHEPAGAPEGGGERAAGPSSVPSSAAGGDMRESEAPGEQRVPPRGTRDWQRDPAVSEVLKVFEARIIDVRE
jgi:DNA polymerase III subunit gamma/tau